MFELKIRDHFASAHFLKGYQGACQHLHGHTWKVEIIVTSDVLDSVGLVADFKILKKILKEVLMPLDHVHLNELDAFKEINPSTENLAKYIYNQSKTAFAPLRVKSIEVWESDTASVVYHE